MKLDVSKTALTLGVIMAGFHFGWSLLVAFGLAQSLMDFIFSIHMIVNPYRIADFSISLALILIVTTFVIGYAFGWIFALVWNRMHR